MVVKEIKNIFFFDGVNSSTNAIVKNEYWFGSADSAKYLKASIFFLNENQEKVKIEVFGKSKDLIHKPLSDWNAPEMGFYEEDLISLSKDFKFELRKDNKGNTGGFITAYPLE
ncbi:MAG: hypothetical protein ACTHJT_05785, partial [Cytophaga sp.]|uniref:hypothetical protein n=1 Tax=Cytophaga sp. TaxID=29535 RepID=UPI003F810547